MAAIRNESLAQLQHELRTPINHILGYSELLIEDACERHLEGFVLAFEQIHTRGHQLLEAIQATFAEKTIAVQGLDLGALKTSLATTAAELLKISTSILTELESGHQHTLTDLNAIGGAVSRLMELAGEHRVTGGGASSQSSLEDQDSHRCPDLGRKEERKGSDRR